MSNESSIGQQCVTVLYPNSDDVRFDFDYYRDQHLPHRGLVRRPAVIVTR